MKRFGLTALFRLTLVQSLRADAFDNYTALIVAKAPDADGG